MKNVAASIPNMSQMSRISFHVSLLLEPRSWFSCTRDASRVGQRDADHALPTRACIAMHLLDDARSNYTVRPRAPRPKNRGKIVL
jgi:hypothetical protein